jgi:elongation factor P
MIVATQIRVGQILKIDKNLFRVLKVQHITPGKGNAVVQTELRNLKTKNKDNIRFRSAETVEQADVTVQKVNFLYQEGSTYHFMDPASFEQMEITEDVLDEILPYLTPEVVLTVSSYEGTPVSVSLPLKMTFEIVECDPPEKGMAGASKSAKLSNGILVKVPLFIKTGDRVVVDTETGEYVEKG